jgi:ABC-2 type transport system ATP-binding protein
VNVRDGELTCEVEEAGMAPVMAALADAGLRRLNSQQPTLEEVFLKHYQDGPADD